MAMEHDRDIPLRADRGREHGKLTRLEGVHADFACLEPCLDELGGRLDTFGRRGVVADQALG